MAAPAYEPVYDVCRDSEKCARRATSTRQLRLHGAASAAPLGLRRQLLHFFLLLERHGEFLLDPLAVNRAGVVGAEGVNQTVGGGVVDHATLHALHIVVVGIHEVHAGHHQGLVGEALLLALAAAILLV